METVFSKTIVVQPPIHGVEFDAGTKTELNLAFALCSYLSDELTAVTEIPIKLSRMQGSMSGSVEVDDIRDILAAVWGDRGQASFTASCMSFHRRSINADQPNLSVSTESGIVCLSSIAHSINELSAVEYDDYFATNYEWVFDPSGSESRVSICPICLDGCEFLGVFLESDHADFSEVMQRINHSQVDCGFAIPDETAFSDWANGRLTADRISRCMISIQKEMDSTS